MARMWCALGETFIILHSWCINILIYQRNINVFTHKNFNKTKSLKYCSPIRSSGLLKQLLHFTSLTDLFNQTPSQLFWEASSHMLQLMHEGCSYTYPPLSIARYSNLPKVLTPQHRIQTWVLLVKSPKLYLWAIALITNGWLTLAL